MVITEKSVSEENRSWYGAGPVQTAAISARRLTSAELRQWLITNIAAVLEIDPATIDVSRNLDELGLDSLQSVCLAGDLEAWLGTEIPATAIWDYPTIDCLCEYLTGAIAAV